MLVNQKATLEIYFSFLLRTTHQNKKGEKPIILRVVYRGERRDIFTGLYCSQNNWHKEGKMVNNSSRSGPEINRQLQNMLFNANQAFQLLKYSGDEFTMNELVDQIKGKTPPPQTLMEYIELKEQEILKRVGSDLAQSTWYKYKRTIKYLREFLILKKGVRNIPVSRIDSEFIKDFFQFLRKDKKNCHNSASALLGCFNSILQPAVKNRTIKYNPFIDFVVKRKPVERDFLDLDEIRRLQELKDLSPELSLKRDIFLLACFTGMAYSDLKALSKQDILLDNDGTKYIKHPRTKTGGLSIIPLLPVAEEILINYSPTEDCRDFIWRVPSNQKLNLGLKKIAELAKIDKPLFTHLGRHTFATTVTLSNGVSMESVSKMLGHTSLKHTMIYAKVVASKIKSEMKQLRDIFKNF